jgi:hypothetical protein
MVHFVLLASPLISKIPELLLDIVVQSVQVLFDRVFALRGRLHLCQYTYNIERVRGDNYLKLHLGQAEHDIT